MFVFKGFPEHLDTSTPPLEGSNAQGSIHQPTFGKRFLKTQTREDDLSKEMEIIRNNFLLPSRKYVKQCSSSCAKDSTAVSLPLLSRV